MNGFSPSDRIDALRLARSENVGPITYAQLLRRYGTPGQALRALPELARRGGRSGPLAIATAADAAREIDRVM